MSPKIESLNGGTGAIEPVPYVNRYARYNATAAGRARRTKYRRNNSKWETDAHYLSRRIVGIDGEGVTRADGSHDYIMLAISDVAPLRHADNSALESAEILEFLWKTLSPDDLNVIYGGSYDFNMWIKGMPREQLKELYKGNYLSKGVEVGEYTVRWMNHKSFTIRRDDKSVTIFDVVSFFQRPFIEACDMVLKEYPGRDILVKEKAARSVFKAEDADEISDYNQLEIKLLCNLVKELRASLNKIGLRPHKWYGPGAVATAVFRKHDIRKHMTTCPRAVTIASRYAFAAGRFELFKYGDYDRPVWEYDIHSAHPSGMAELPDIAAGIWRHVKCGPLRDFSLYHIVYHHDDVGAAGAFFHRTERGSISFPADVDTWAWGVEVKAGQDYVRKYGGSIRIIEAWIFEPGNDAKPFNFVRDLYRKRAEAKARGDGTQLAYKLSLNSLYGKTCQQIGWVPARNGKPARIPPYHQLEYAGYITAHTRALIMRAITLDRDAIIATETDAVFSTRKLPLPLTDELGDWEETEFKNLTYIQSGHYYAEKTNGKQIIRCRGVDRGFLNRHMIQEKLHSMPVPVLTAPLTRFYGAGIALMRTADVWCRWNTEDKVLALYPTGKRIHVPCKACVSGMGHDWHTTVVPIAGGVSAPFPIEWDNPDRAMQKLADARWEERDYDDM